MTSNKRLDFGELDHDADPNFLERISTIAG